MPRDWHEWHRRYDDPASSLSRRLTTVRVALRRALETCPTPPAEQRILRLCAGDGRDTLPVLAALRWPGRATLVELDAGLAARARASGTAAGIAGLDVRTADASSLASFADAAPVDVLLLCGIFGNVADADVVRTIDAAPALLRPGGAVIWTRGSTSEHDAGDPSGDHVGDRAESVRAAFAARGFDEVDFVRPDDATFRVGVVKWPTASEPPATTSGEVLFRFA